MGDMRTKEDIRKRLEAGIDYYNARIEAWGKVKRATKKDGTDFAAYGKNFEGAETGKYYGIESAMHPYLTVAFRNGNKYETDHMRVYLDERDSDYQKNPEREAYTGETWTYDTERLTPDEAMQAIQNHIAKYTAWKEKDENELKNLDECFEEVESHVQAIRDMLKRAKGEELSSTLVYALEDYVKSRMTCI